MESTSTDPATGTQPTIATERLRLVPLGVEHTNDVVDLFADPAASAHLGVDLSDPAAAHDMVQRRLAYPGPRALGHWVVSADTTIVGIAHVRPSWELPGELPEIGWYLGTHYTGRATPRKPPDPSCARGSTHFGCPLCGR